MTLQVNQNVPALTLLPLLATALASGLASFRDTTHPFAEACLVLSCTLAEQSNQTYPFIIATLAPFTLLPFRTLNVCRNGTGIRTQFSGNA